jgi:hypothetical protein
MGCDESGAGDARHAGMYIDKKIVDREPWIPGATISPHPGPR